MARLPETPAPKPLDLTATDAKRTREIPLRVYAPAATAPVSGTSITAARAPPNPSLAVSTPARRGPVDNPLPISELQTVMNALLVNGHSTEDPNCF